MTPTDDLEQHVTDLLAAGDLAGAATTALRTLGPQILGYLVATMRDETAAYDVFGHFSEQLWKSIGTFRGTSSFKTWTYKLVMHSIGRYRRDGFRRRARSLGSAHISAIVAEVRSSTAPFKRTDVKDRIARLRAQLDSEEQTLLFLRVDQDLSWNEVAEVIAERGKRVDVAVLRKRFERAKARLRKLADKDGLLRD